MMIRKFKDYSQYYSTTSAYVWSFGRFDTSLTLKRVKPKTNALIFTDTDGSKRILASGLKGINRYLKLHEEIEIEL